MALTFIRKGLNSYEYWDNKKQKVVTSETLLSDEELGNAPSLEDKEKLQEKAAAGEFNQESTRKEMEAYASDNAIELPAGLKTKADVYAHIIAALKELELSDDSETEGSIEK